MHREIRSMGKSILQKHQFCNNIAQITQMYTLHLDRHRTDHKSGSNKIVLRMKQLKKSQKISESILPD